MNRVARLGEVDDLEGPWPRVIDRLTGKAGRAKRFGGAKRVQHLETGVEEDADDQRVFIHRLTQRGIAATKKAAEKTAFLLQNGVCSSPCSKGERHEDAVALRRQVYQLDRRRAL
jgi:hypothetical protein